MLANVISFFERQSATANFLQIAGAGLTVTFATWRAVQWFGRWRVSNRIRTVSGWLQRATHGPATARGLRIAVVDDRPDDYPLDSLRRIGYSIAHVAHLTLADVPSLKGYDCVLLDINGVLDEDPKRGGLDVLKRLKAEEGPYVVAVSSKGFDITLSEFFMLADHRLKKPIPPADVEGIIERAYECKFSAEHAARRVDEAAAFGTSRSRATRRALLAVRQYLETGRALNEARSALSLIVPAERMSSTMSDLAVVRRSLGRSP